MMTIIMLVIAGALHTINRRIGYIAILGYIPILIVNLYHLIKYRGTNSENIRKQWSVVALILLGLTASSLVSWFLFTSLFDASGDLIVKVMPRGLSLPLFIAGLFAHVGSVLFIEKQIKR